jgi:hypothetical protein
MLTLQLHDELEIDYCEELNGKNIQWIVLKRL